jgi:hypothetical protein
VQALETIPAARVGWLLMADQDVVVDDMTFEVPLSQYEGQDLVLYGSLKLVAADTYQNLLSVGYKDRQQGQIYNQATLRGTTLSNPKPYTLHPKFLIPSWPYT